MGLRIKHLSYTFPSRTESPEPGPHTICADLSLSFDGGTNVALLGRNGLGKTTLLRLLAGLTSPTALPPATEPGAKIAFELADGSTAHADARTWTELLPQHATLVFQEYSKVVFEWQTVEDALRWVRPNVDAYYSNVVDLFTNLALPTKRNLYWGDLSGGQKQALALARALLRDPDVLLLDEPLASIDASFRYSLANALVGIHRLRRKDNRVVLLVTHDVDEAVFIANRILILDGPPLRVVQDIPSLTPLAERDSSYRLHEEFLAVRTRVYTEFAKLAALDRASE